MQMITLEWKLNPVNDSIHPPIAGVLIDLLYHSLDLYDIYLILHYVTERTWHHGKYPDTSQKIINLCISGFS